MHGSPRASTTTTPRLLAALAVAACALASTTASAGAVVHLKGWRWQDITNNMGAVRAAGYTAILISPHTSTCGGGFSDGYDPSDFTRFDSRFGNEGELAWLVQTAHDHGVQVYADMVMNHMCPAGYAYPRFSWNDFHHNGGITNWDDAFNLESFDLLGLNDLAHESPYVRGELWNFLVKTNELGIDGYRFDGAKHVPRWYWRDHVVGNVQSWGKLAFGEVYSANLDVLQSYVDIGMSVTDYNLYDAIQRAFRFEGDLGALDGAGYAGRNGAKAMTFVENHDVGPPPNRMLAYAFLAAYPGYPTFFNVSLQNADMNNLVWIHNAKAHGAYLNRWKERDVLVFERQGNLLAAFNQTGEWQTRWVQTSWRGRTLHDYAGNAGDVWVNDDGYAPVSIPPMGWVMLAP